MTHKTDASALARLIGYQFKNENLIHEALTHRSASSVNNERLEFLGDSILNFVIAEALFQRYPEVTEGDLSRLRAVLVKKEGLSRIANDLDLSPYLILGSGELKSGGYRRDSILADTVEAILGAVYLDAGFDECRQLILRLYKKQMDEIPALAELKDAKTRLQELLQAYKLALPEYEVTDISGKAHQQIFTIQCHIPYLSVMTQGRASSRRKAEQEAASLAIIQVADSLKKRKR